MELGQPGLNCMNDVERNCLWYFSYKQLSLDLQFSNRIYLSIILPFQVSKLHLQRRGGAHLPHMPTAKVPFVEASSHEIALLNSLPSPSCHGEGFLKFLILL